MASPEKSAWRQPSPRARLRVMSSFARQRPLADSTQARAAPGGVVAVVAVVLVLVLVLMMVLVLVPLIWNMMDSTV